MTHKGLQILPPAVGANTGLSWLCPTSGLKGTYVRAIVLDMLSVYRTHDGQSLLWPRSAALTAQTSHARAKTLETQGPVETSHE
mmetsp:Transcript_80138/g.259016  ORF Transcript_80138/g.259016 Transcript_80138/m.259016 type:complete len:84 (+) Transcript_80138:239-490(+)